jgi:hypothetical protein
MSTHAKTDAGRAEIKARALPLSRPARNLLLIVDPKRPLAEWVTLVQGATEADADHLLAQGLIAPVGQPGGMPAAPAPEPGLALAEAVNSLGYSALYSLLTSQARERLGLIKGYRLVLEVERCSGIDELRPLALRFFTQLREQQGEQALAALRQALAAASH